MAGGLDFLHTMSIVAGSVLVFIILWDTFETIIVPRTLVRALPVRLTRLFYSNVWPLWKATVNAVLPSKWREVYLELSAHSRC